MFKPGDKVKFVGVDELEKYFYEAIGKLPNKNDIKVQKKLQGIVTTIKSLEYKKFFISTEKVYIYDKISIGRIKKFKNIELDYNLFEL